MMSRNARQPASVDEGATVTSFNRCDECLEARREYANSIVATAKLSSSFTATPAQSPCGQAMYLISLDILVVA